MVNDLIEVVEGEDESLILHTKLCSLRYQQLITKFDVVDQRLDELTLLCADIKTSLTQINSDTKDTYLKWSGFIIVTLLGIVIHFVLK